MALPRSRASLVSVATLSAVGAGTTFVALLSWRGFSELSIRWLTPLLVVAVVMVGSGALARWWRAPGALVVAVQLLATGVVTCLFVTGSPLPVFSAWHRLLEEFSGAYTSANRYAPPVPSDVPPVDPILLAGGVACMLLVDVLACTLRRIPLAGLPLLTIFSVPLGMLGHGPSWLVFALTAGGFMAMLFVHEDEQVSRWGRSLGRESGGEADAFDVRTGAIRASAGTIGGVVTAIAVLVPAVIPTLDLHVLDIGPGSGGNGEINIENPMVDLRRDLIKGEDNDLVTVVTDDPDPSYLRIAVLNRFSDDAWSSGDRDVPSGQVARGDLPPLAGVDDSVPRQQYDYQLSSTSDFRSKWLPTQSQITRIDAPGDWRYDLDTRDFISGDDDLTAADTRWSFTGVQLNLDANQLAVAASAANLVDEEYTELPDGMDSIVRELALAVTDKAPSRFEKAVALQQWFREDGDFTYDDSRELSSGADDLPDFLREGDGGRTGYCEQFAAAMAVMARILGIPARVAVGFLHPDRVDDQTWVYSAHDLHAWPELYLGGAGWVRFEPTPGGRAETVPAYTKQEVDIPDVPTASASEDTVRPAPRDSVSPTAGPQTDESDQAGGGSGFPWWQTALVLALVALVVLALLSPRALRRRRRSARLAGGPEDVWVELRDTAHDLGLAWPRSRSPRQTADALVRWFGAPPDEFTAERPRRGPETNPGAVDALDRIVLALEVSRYAERDPGPAGSWAADAEASALALAGGTTQRARRRAEWWPRSLFSRERVVVRPVAEEDVEQPAYSGVVDHVG